MNSFSDSVKKEYLDGLNEVTSILNEYAEKSILCISCLKQRDVIFDKIRVKDDFNSFVSKSDQYKDLYSENFCSKNDLSERSNFTCVSNTLISNQENYVSSEKVTNTDLLDFGNQNEKFSRVLPRWPLVVYFISGMMCLGFSATFHLFTSHKLIVKRIFNRLDYAGISILIVGSCYPPYYYYFFCRFRKFMLFNSIFRIRYWLFIIHDYIRVNNLRNKHE